MARTVLNTRQLGVDLVDQYGKLLSVGDDIVMVSRGGYLVRGNITHQSVHSIFIKDKHIRKTNCHYQVIKL